jgi:ATP-dependent DNA helicase RecQ
MLSENLPDMAIGTSLKILEREGLISRPNEKQGQAFFKLHSDFSKAVNSLGDRAKKQIEILVKLNDRYGPDLLNGFNFNPEEIASILGVKKDTMLRALKKLVEEQIAEYQPPFRGTEIKILKRTAVNELNIDLSALKEKMRKAYEKLDQIENYIYCDRCRQEFILDYFGDLNSRVCGKCDNCLTKNGYRRKHDAPSQQTKDKKIFSKNFQKTSMTENEYRVEPARKNPSLSTKLTQLETLELFNNGLSPAEIAQKRNLKPDTVVAHLCFLIEKKLIKNIDKLVSKNNQNKIQKAIKKVGSEKLTLIKEELGDDFGWDEIKLAVAFERKS